MIEQGGSLQTDLEHQLSSPDVAVRPATGVGRARWAIPVALLVVGTAVHLWYVFHTPLSSDEAVSGLMARAMLHGHFTAFYWGQSYGGSAEPFVIAVFFAVFGQSTIVMEFTELLLAAGAVFLTWRIARRLVSDPWLAAMAAAIIWIAPQSWVANSTVTYGFRGVALVCGLGVLLLAQRMVALGISTIEVLALGLIAGVGWWSSPEVVYFFLPAALLLGWRGWINRREVTVGGVIRLAALTGVGFVLGALPWIWANASSHLRSLRTSALQVPPGSPGFLGRLENFPKMALPMVFSLRQQLTASWLGGTVVGTLMYAGLAAVLLVGLYLAARRPGPSRIIAISLVAFPFLMAVSPATWYLRDGRYMSYAVPLVVLTLAIGAEEVSLRRRPVVIKRRWLFSGVAAVLAATSLWSFSDHVAPASPFTAWSLPDSPTSGPIRLLRSQGIAEGFADYWVAYRLDFLSHGALRLSVPDNETKRWPQLDAEVRNSANPAWLFVTPTPQELDQFGFTMDIRGPGGLPESAFLAYLRSNGIGFRIVRAGPIDAVQPASRVVPADLGLV
jgi:hypothetical protein